MGGFVKMCLAPGCWWWGGMGLGSDTEHQEEVPCTGGVQAGEDRVAWGARR